MNCSSKLTAFSWRTMSFTGTNTPRPISRKPARTLSLTGPTVLPGGRVSNAHAKLLARPPGVRKVPPAKIEVTIASVSRSDGTLMPDESSCNPDR